MKNYRNFILHPTLAFGTFFYFVGMIVHWFGITLWPWFDAALFSPYHDRIIAMAAVGVCGFFYVTWKNPEKNRDNLWVMSYTSLITGIATIWMAFNVDFAQYGSVVKVNQAIAEGILLVGLFGVLMLYLMKTKGFELEGRLNKGN